MMVREGFLEEVGLEESREKCQGMPAMQKSSGRWNQPGWRQGLGERFRAWLRVFVGSGAL